MLSFVLHQWVPAQYTSTVQGTGTIGKKVAIEIPGVMSDFAGTIEASGTKCYSTGTTVSPSR